MVRSILAAGGIALALSVLPAAAQQAAPEPSQAPEPKQAPDQPPSAQPVDPSLVGLVVYSSDGHKLGQVTDVGLSGGQPAIRADMGEFLGTDKDSGSVIIGSRGFQRKEDRVEVAMTADQIKQAISAQRQERKQP